MKCVLELAMDPEILGGQMCVNGTRLPIHMLIKTIRNGHGSMLVTDYGLTVQQANMIVELSEATLG